MKHGYFYVDTLQIHKARDPNQDDELGTRILARHLTKKYTRKKILGQAQNRT